MEQQGVDTLGDAAQRPFGSPATQQSDPSCGERPLLKHSDWRRALRKTIEARVVPRLTTLGREALEAPDVRPVSAVDDEQVARFAHLVIGASVPGLIHFIDDLRAGGLSIEHILLDLMSPAARYLGDLWLADKLSFLDVTAGLGRLQGVTRALGPDFDGETPGLIHGKKILLAPVSGEQHIFGLSVVAAFFRRAGWDVTFEPRVDFDHLLAIVAAERFTAIGLSAGGDRFVERLPGQVAAIRQASLARHATILAGGPAFLVDPDLNLSVGADAVARDATEAVQLAEALSGQAVMA